MEPASKVGATRFSRSDSNPWIENRFPCKRHRMLHVLSKGVRAVRYQSDDPKAPLNIPADQAGTHLTAVAPHVIRESGPIWILGLRNRP